MKMWRVYVTLWNGKRQCRERSFTRARCQTIAWMYGLGIGDVARVEMISPEGVVWAYDRRKPGMPDEIADAEARMMALDPDELDRRKKAASAHVNSYFTGDVPRTSQVVERVMQKFRERTGMNLQKETRP